MSIEILNPSETLPVTLEDAKLQLRIEHDDEDSAIERMIRSAQAYVEIETSLYLQPCEVRQSYERWCRKLEITRAPVREILDVEYVDTDGDYITVGIENYHFERTHEGGFIIFKDGFEFPELDKDFMHRVRVTFAAGFDSLSGNSPGPTPLFPIPPMAQEIVLQLTGHWYDNREAIFHGTGGQVDPQTRAALAKLRIFRR